MGTILLATATVFPAGCSSTYFRRTTYDYYHYYYRQGYTYGRPGTGTVFSLDPCNSLTEAKVRGSTLHVTVKKGPWIAFPVPGRGGLPFRMTDRGMFLNVRSGGRWTTWTQKNGNVWEQRNHAACILLVD